jgi:hypothetical protein
MAVAVLPGRRDDRETLKILQLPDPAQRVFYGFLLGGELLFVCDVLPRTAAAPAEIDARRGPALGRGTGDLDQRAHGVPAFIFKPVSGTNTTLWLSLPTP